MVAGVSHSLMVTLAATGCGAGSAVHELRCLSPSPLFPLRPCLLYGLLRFGVPSTQPFDLLEVLPGGGDFEAAFYVCDISLQAAGSVPRSLWLGPSLLRPRRFYMSSFKLAFAASGRHGLVGDGGRGRVSTPAPALADD